METALFGPDPTLPQARSLLRGLFGDLRGGRRLEPIWQLVKAMISGRTEDAVSWAAFERLRGAWPTPEALMAAHPDDIEPVIAGVTFADAKAAWLVSALRGVHAWSGALDLAFLADLPTEAAFRKLRNLVGVGPKVAAATLNHSSLRRPIIVVDSHVCRVAGRLGLVGRANLERAQEQLTAILDPRWDSDDLYELHSLFKRLGQEICIHGAPHCRRCPLSGLCPSARAIN